MRFWIISTPLENLRAKRRNLDNIKVLYDNLESRKVGVGSSDIFKEHLVEKIILLTLIVF